MLITVAICTWNRSDLLDRTLSELKKIAVPPGIQWKVLVINNNCTDDTDAVIMRHADDLPVERLLVPRQGLSHARNAAVAHAEGEWLIFTDDDVLVTEAWLQAYAQAFAQASETVAFMGGEITPWFPIQPDPALLEAVEMVRDGFCRRALPADPVITRFSDHLPFGANFALRLKYARQRQFDPALGVQGNLRILGEEVVFMKQLLEDGFEGRWVSGALVRHYVDPKRLTHRSLRRALYDSGRTMARRGKVLEGKPRVGGIPLWAYRLLFEAALNLLFPLSWFTHRVNYYVSLRNFWYYSGFAKEYLCGVRDSTVRR